MPTYTEVIYCSDLPPLPAPQQQVAMFSDAPPAPPPPNPLGLHPDDLVMAQLVLKPWLQGQVAGKGIREKLAAEAGQLRELQDRAARQAAFGGRW